MTEKVISTCNIVAQDACTMNVTETLKAVSHNINIFWSWGVSKRINFQDKGLLLRVSGNHFKGWVMITLNGMDLYNVHYIALNGELKEEMNDIYCEDLQEIIDNRIEKIPEYVR